MMAATEHDSDDDGVEADVGGALPAAVTDVAVDGHGEATDAEAAAVAAAVSAHLADCRAAAARRTRGEHSERVDQWSFAGRLAAVGERTRRRPRSVDRGEEWRAAARTL